MFRPDCVFQGRSYINRPNPDPTSIFQHPTVRTVVCQNLADTGMGWQFAIQFCGLSRDSYARLLQGEYPAVPNRRGDQRRMLARWLDLHTIVDSFQHDKSSFSFFVQALALRGDEAIFDPKMLGLRMAYEVYAALSRALEMEVFLTYARAITYQYEALLRPTGADRLWDWKLAEFLRDAHACSLGLPTISECNGAWIDYLRLVASGERELESLGQDSMERQFADYMSERFRPFILPIWPDGSCVLIAERLRSNAWTGHEAVWIAYLFLPPSPPHELLETDRAEYLRQTEEIERVLEAFRPDSVEFAKARQNIVLWLGKNSDDLVHLVRPCRAARSAS